MRATHLVATLALLLGALQPGCREPPAAEGAIDPSSASTTTPTVTLADSLYRAGAYTRAKEVWSLALTQVRTQDDPSAEARILTSLGLTEWRLGRYEAARSRAEEARALLESRGLVDQLPRTLNALGLIAWDQGRMREAAELWLRTMTVARAAGDQEYVDKPAMNLGLWYAGIGELERADSAFAASLRAGRALAIRPLELRSLVNLAMVANRMGEPRRALAWLDSAAAADVQEDFLAEDNYRSQLAIAAWAMGEPGVALTGLDSGVRVARASGLRQSEAANLTLMADIYWEAGDPTRALGLHAQAEAIHGELELPAEQGSNLYSAARIHAAMGHAEQAHAMASRALELHRRSDDLVHQLDDHLVLAELGDREHLVEARRIAIKLATRTARMRLGLAEARIAASDGRPATVLSVLSTLSAALAAGMSAEIAEAEALRARAYGMLQRWDSSAAAGRRGITALERMRGSHGSGLLRASFASFRAGVYGEQVAALLALGRTEEAFDVADAARGESSRPYGSTGRTPASAAGRRNALQRIESLEQEVRNREEAELNADELRGMLRQAQRDFEIAVLSAGGVASSAPESQRRLHRVRERLGPHELMLAYLVTPERLFVFTVSSEAARAQVLPVPASDIEARVRLARQMLSTAEVSEQQATPVLAALGQWLLGSVDEAGSDVRRLVIVPHGVLSYLPFAALKTTDGKYLVERYSLVHLPSAAVPPGGAAHPASGGPPKVRVTALAPFPRELPATAVEVRAIGRAQRGSRVLVGRDADEQALRASLRSEAVTHVATHGALNTMNPLFSRIELVPGRRRPPSDDGRLEVHEVLELDIRSPLVFLSGCETGLGPGGSRRHSPGEDYATLAAAFLGAGAGQVVATLWAIPDTGAAVFASRFYDRLESGAAAEALVAAQRAMLSDRRHRHPYFWAGYRISGWEAIPRRAAVS